MNANIIQLFTGCNTFLFHCYFNQNRLWNRKTHNCMRKSKEAETSVVCFPKDETAGHTENLHRVCLEE